MTFSKKLIFMVVCVFTAQVTLPYFHATALKTEVLQILNFVDVLYKHDTQEAKRAAEWLQEILESDGKDTVLSNTDIIEIAKTSTTDITIDAKLKIIDKKMVAEEKMKAAQKKESLRMIAISVIFAGLMFVLLQGAFKKDIEIWELRLNRLDERMKKTILECIQIQKDQAEI